MNAIFIWPGYALLCPAVLERVPYWDVVPAMEALAQRLAAVRERMTRAAERARRDPAGIMLLAVTKVFPATVIREAYELGLREFGENYVQEFEGKASEVGGLPGARFHLIGHLQSNKSARAAELFQVVRHPHGQFA